MKTFLFWRLKEIIFGEKKSKSDFIFFYSVRLIDHSVGNKCVETSVPEFSGILP